MPEISRFYGIVVKMYFENSAKHRKPHIHVSYGEYEAVIALDGEILSGDIPGRPYKILMQWMILHKEEIERMWECALRNEPVWKITPYDKNAGRPDVISEETVYGEDESGLTHILDAQPLRDRMLLLTFSTGKKKLFDTNLLQGPVFEPLREEKVFRNIRIDNGAVTWMNGEIDCAPEYMYVNGCDYPA